MFPSQSRHFLLEVCVDSAESAVAAECGGAGRVELCDNLHIDGTTPTEELIRNTRSKIGIPLHVMIRPHDGPYHYSPSDFSLMKAQIQIAKECGADGVVLAVLHEEFTIDCPRLKELVELARPMSVTFHRAFDLIKDQFRGLDELIGLGIGRVLTSGGRQNVDEGFGCLSALVQHAAGRITILPGGGVSLENGRRLIEKVGVKELHVLRAVSNISDDGRGTYDASKKYLVQEARVRSFIDHISSDTI